MSLPLLSPHISNLPCEMSNEGKKMLKEYLQQRIGEEKQGQTGSKRLPCQA